MTKKQDETKPLPPDPEEQNDDRAEWALDAVQCFMKRTGLTEEGDGLDTAIYDLIADLAHLCDRRGLDLYDLCRQSHEHYSAETDGVGTQLDFAVGWKDRT
jgi:hypothetical protein